MARELQKFIQLKRCKVWWSDYVIETRVNVSYCCRVTSCTGSLGLQNSLYRVHILKLVQCCKKTWGIWLFDNIEATFKFDLCTLLLWLLWPQASCTGCDPAAIWNIDPWPRLYWVQVDIPKGHYSKWFLFQR